MRRVRQGVSRACPLEYQVCLLQQVLRRGGVADGRGAAAQVGQRVGLAQGTASRAGQFKGVLVMRLCDVAGAPVGEGLLEWRDGPALIEPCESGWPVSVYAENCRVSS